MTGPRMYGCRDSETPKEKSPSGNEKGTMKDVVVDTASAKRPKFSELVAELERKQS